MKAKLNSPEYPKFKDSCDIMEILFSSKMAYRLPKRPQSPRLSGIFLRLFMWHTQFFKVESISGAILEVSREIFGTFCGLFISTFKQRNIGKILVGFQGRWTSIYYFFNSQIFYEVLDIFPWLSHRLTLIMLNVGMVDNLTFAYAFHSRVSTRAVLLLFFALSLCIFSFQG